jgi:hypothetical protein
MKTNFKNQVLKHLSLWIIVFAFFGCQNDENDFEDAKFSTTGAIFIDNPVAMGTLFYLPYGGSKLSAWQVDNEVSYLGTSSMRFDVPNANDPQGNYAGAIFRVDGAPRNLTQYNALTFWIKASQGVTISEFGFGEDFIDNKFIASIANISVGTAWTKIIIPIPDASKLTEERGMFRYAAGSQGTNGAGYTFWIDELKFEKLGAIGQPRPAISNGVNKTLDSFIGVTIPITGLEEKFNLPSGIDQTVIPAVSYFVFKSSNPSVATVNTTGQISVVGSGLAIITGNIGGTLNTDTNEFAGGIDSVDSITINSLGDFSLAPTPTRPANNVLSVFSDFYTNVPVTYYNGFWTPGSTTGSADFSVNGDNILNYTNFNYVGTAFTNPTLDASAMTHVHFNMYIPGNIPPNFSFLISIEDWGANQVDNGGDDTRQQIFVTSGQVQPNTWITIESPLNLVNKNNIGLIIYENINGSSLSNFYLDNIYFFNQ